MLQALVPSPSDKHRPSADFTNLQKPLAQFRATTRRLKVHPLELAALWVISGHLALLPWALGSTRAWAQVPSLILAALGLGVALLPRAYTEEHTGSNSFRLIMWPNSR